MKKTDYKWIDIEKEKNTTENSFYWAQGIFIIILFFIIMILIKQFKNK